MEVKGRDLVAGIPKTLIISDEEISKPEKGLGENTEPDEVSISAEDYAGDDILELTEKVDDLADGQWWWDYFSHTTFKIIKAAAGSPFFDRRVRASAGIGWQRTGITPERR